MKTAAFALAALVALSGAAFAGENGHVKNAKPAACVETTLKAKLDCNATGSIDKDHRPANVGTSGKKLGIDINPWIVPTF